MVWELPYQISQQQLTGLDVPLGLTDFLFPAQFDLNNRVQIAKHSASLTIGNACLNFSRHAVASHLQATIYIAQNDVNLTFGIIKAKTDILQTNFAI